MTLSVRSDVHCLPVSASVENDIKNDWYGTDVDCTEDMSKNMQNSIIENKASVQSHVQNFNEINQTKNDFEFDSDDDSEISFFISTESVEDYGEAAL